MVVPSETSRVSSLMKTCMLQRSVRLDLRKRQGCARVDARGRVDRLPRATAWRDSRRYLCHSHGRVFLHNR